MVWMGEGNGCDDDVRDAVALVDGLDGSFESLHVDYLHV